MTTGASKTLISGQPDAEGRERGECGGSGVLGREVLDVEDQRGGGAEEEEVVPFERRADERADGDLVGVLDAEFLGRVVFDRRGSGLAAHA